MNIPNFSKDELIEYAKNFRSKAKENAPKTIKLNYAGVTVGAVAFGPAGAVAGATVGSSIGYFLDKKDSETAKESEVIEADLKKVI
ncbi:hypothetical protein [Haloplanus salilacus]|uniref:hypothetical protein n=1 Tax=Haloplanus salilacus TaxID=2949994 RepID=UPI0030D5B36A